MFAADGRDLLTGTGVLMRLSSSGLVPTGVSVLLPRGQRVVGLTDGDRGVVTIGAGPPGRHPVDVTVFGQRSVSLGDADAVAGDPEQAGVVASLASSQLPQ
jgi:hypothetical protein